MSLPAGVKSVKESFLSGVSLRAPIRRIKIIPTMKPIVSAAAAVFLLAGRRHAMVPKEARTRRRDAAARETPGDDEHEGAHAETTSVTNSGVDSDNDSHGIVESEPPEDESQTSMWARGQVMAAPALFDVLRSRRRASKSGGLDLSASSSSSSHSRRGDFSGVDDDDDDDWFGEDSALGIIRRGIRRAQRAAQLQEFLRMRSESEDDDSDSSGEWHFFGRRPSDFPLSRIANPRDSDAGDSDEESDIGNKYDVRPLLAVSMGVTLFLLTRAPKESYRAELERSGNVAGRSDEEDVTDLLLSRGISAAEWQRVSDMRTRTRNIVIITTAALPWMTGTAVNPLLRAAYLAKAGHTVTIVVPWLESPEDQRKVFPANTLFTTREHQGKVILKWATEQVPNVNLAVRFYEGVYSDEFGSILPLGDLTALFSDDPVRDVCVLEEPEHLTWHHTGARWTRLFEFCVGVVHTNYIEYARKHGVFGPQRALFLNFLNKWVCRSYCHRVIKLSDAVQELPHSVTCNVHGVREKFLQIGKSRRGKPFQEGVYFLGKVLWAKGYAQLVELMEDHFDRTGERLSVDFFGAGPDLPAVRHRVESSEGLSGAKVHGVVVDHASEHLQKFKVYINPSISDVVCTATAEALAMGKFAICLKHPSNEFFSTFENCLIYETPEEFSELVQYAMNNEPKALSEDELYRLSWEAATDRFYDSCLYVPDETTEREDSDDDDLFGWTTSRGVPIRAPPGGRFDSALAATHKTICSRLVTPPASNAVRARYRAERRTASERRRRDSERVSSGGSSPQRLV